MTGPEATGMRTFFRIAERWKLTDDELVRILGLGDKTHLESLKSGEAPQFATETLERVSFVLGIYKAINTLLPVPERADGWIRAANTAAIFAGKTPADRMTTGEVTDLQAVRRYLEAQLQ